MEPFWYEQVHLLERRGTPYTGEREKWWWSARFGWFLAALADPFVADLRRVLDNNAELY
jgi:hypothetical protein